MGDFGVSEVKKYSQCDNVQEYLNQSIEIDQRIRIKLTKIEYYRNLSISTSTVFGTAKTSGVSRSNKLENCIDKIADLEKSVKDDLTELVKIKTEIEDIIKKVKETKYRQLLELRYICNKKWEDVANAMYYSEGHVKNCLHSQALKKVENILIYTEIYL